MKGLIATLVAVHRDYCIAHNVAPLMALWEAIAILLYCAAIAVSVALLAAAVPL